MSHFLFATPISIWLLLAVWPVLVVAISWLYRREWAEMSRPSAIGLLVLRAAAATLLLLCLAQPVWEVRFTEQTPLAVPILLDNSRSVWYPDPHRPAAEKVELAERLRFLAPGLRFKSEEFFRKELPGVRQALDPIGQAQLDFDSEPSEQQTEAIEERYKRSLRLSERFDEMAIKLARASRDSKSLSSQARDSLLLGLRAITNRARTLKESWRSLEQQTTKTGNDYSRIAREMRLGVESAHDFLKSLPQLQLRLDEELAESDDPRVKQAIQAVAHASRIELLLSVCHDLEQPLLPQLLAKNARSPIHVFGEDKPLDPEKQLNADSLKPMRVPRTDFSAEFARLFSRIPRDEELRQVILISDGRDTSGTNETELVELLKRKRVKVIALGLGSTEPMPDAGILTAEMPQRVFDGDSVNLKMKLKLVGRQPSPVRARVMSGDRTVTSREIPTDIARDEMGRFDFNLEFKVRAVLKPDRVEIIPEDGIPENNTRPLDCGIRKEQIRALFIDEFPRWESRYLNMMLRRDKRMDLDKMRILFLGSLKEQNLLRGNELQQFPPDRKSLFDFDLLVIGDVPPDTFSEEEKTNLVSFVKDRGGAIIFLGGPNFMPNAWFGTPLQDLIPVERTRNTALLKAGMNMALTPEGREADFVKSYQGPVSSAGHGRLHWIRGDVQGIPTAAVLSQEESTGLPIAVMSFFGAGKVLYLGSDEFWRWRFRSGWKYHHGFWSHVLLWATSEKIEGESRFAKLKLEKQHFTTVESPEVKLKLIGKDGSPLENSQGFIALTGKTADGLGIDKRIPYQVVDVGGLYRAELGRLATGKYSIEPVVPDLDGEELSATLGFGVTEESSLETLYIHQNQAFLRRLCEETSGQYFDFQDFAKLPEAVARETMQIERIEQTELWDNYWMLLLVAALLITEWALRKRLNLV
jgi:hypothetical protein